MSNYFSVFHYRMVIGKMDCFESFNIANAEHTTLHLTQGSLDQNDSFSSGGYEIADKRNIIFTDSSVMSNI